MKEDGRLTENENLAEEPTIDFLSECLKDENYIVRKEAVIALGKFKEDKRAVDLLSVSLGDKHQDVKRNAAVVLGNLRSKQEISPLEKTPEDGKWQYVSYGTNRYSFDKVRRRRGLNRLKYYLRNK
jgi:HEAT repeat protein